ncbi:MAG TPA: hypothetical protein VLT33_00720 [Labilithrix sp.]|nr:hypothetical protein [Labilithrix sp.]
MGWLKVLVAPAAFPDGAQQQGMPQGGPPMGGGPSPYGVQPGMGQPGMAPPPPAGPAPYDTSGLNSPMQWSTGTKTQGSAQGGLSSPHVAAGAGAGPAGSLEARCAQLQHDVDSLALFARTLLTMLEESKIVTREQFDATKQRLDMLDGKLDDR